LAAIAAGLCALALPNPGFAASVTVTFHRSGTDGGSQAIGTVKLDDTQYGLQFTPALTGLSGGIHNWQARPSSDCPVAGNPPPAKHGTPAAKFGAGDRAQAQIGAAPRTRPRHRFGRRCR